MDTRHTLLTHNLSGFRSDIVEGLLREGFSFLFLQETHHFESSKDLFDRSNRYKTFHVSSMNEQESNHAHVGGLVTYVSNDIVTNTEVLASCKHYLITITGKLVCINVYLPHANHPDGIEAYDRALGEIACHIDSLGDGYAFIVAGDFNSNDRNIKSFSRFIEDLELDHWCSDVPYTFSQGTKGGLCHTKLDHFLVKNFPVDTYPSCQVNTNLVVKGGHLPLQAVVHLPHLEVDTGIGESAVELGRPPRIDYEKINPEESAEFLSRSEALVQDTVRKLKGSYNPLKVTNRVFSELGTLGLCIFPQLRFSFSKKNEPGWNIHVKAAQDEYKAAEAEWSSEGGPMTGATADRLWEAKRHRQACIREMKSQTDKSIAMLMADQISGKTKYDRSKAWKPLRSVIRGNQSESSPVINDLRKKSEIVEFWLDSFQSKLEGSSTRCEIDHPELVRLDSIPSLPIVIHPSDVRQGILNLNKDCAYYDSLSPKLLEFCGSSFDTFMALMLSKFINLP